MSLILLLLIITILILFSAICTGLNIAIMSLDIQELNRQVKLGDKRARNVYPLRKKTHLTLASILLTNVAAVSTTSLVLSHYIVGWLADIISILLIVILGEVIPQALFSNKPLIWANRFSLLLKVMIVVTYPISKPLQLLLDRLFPQNRQQQLQSRQELGLLITEHLKNDSSELDEDEIEIIRGALLLSEKRVRDILTPIKKTYWLTPDTIINDKRINQIEQQRYSRIPIFNSSLTKFYGILLMKDLININFKDNPCIIEDLPLYSSQLVGSMTALDTMFRKFIASNTHLIPVEKDDQIIGIITIEDLLEEIVGHEIEDEADRIVKKTNARNILTKQA